MATIADAEMKQRGDDQQLACATDSPKRHLRWIDHKHDSKRVNDEVLKERQPRDIAMSPILSPLQQRVTRLRQFVAKHRHETSATDSHGLNESVDTNDNAKPLLEGYLPTPSEVTSLCAICQALERNNRNNYFWSEPIFRSPRQTDSKRHQSAPVTPFQSEVGLAAAKGLSEKSVIHMVRRDSGNSSHNAERARANWQRGYKAILRTRGLFNEGSSVGAKRATLPPVMNTAVASPHFYVNHTGKDGKREPFASKSIFLAVSETELDTMAISLQYIFRIDLQYADIKWTVRRTLAEFVNLHLALKLRSKMHRTDDPPPPFPPQLGHIYQTTFASSSSNGSLLSDHVRRGKLEQYLVTLIETATISHAPELCEFLELSALSLRYNMGWKGKEGYLRTKNRSRDYSLLSSCTSVEGKREWVILRDSYLLLCHDTGSSTARDIILFDRAFGFELLKRPWKPGHAIALDTETRRYVLKAPHARAAYEWIQSMQTIKDCSPWVRPHRYDSFAPVRHDGQAVWYVDALDYFRDVYIAILSARSEIYIADWWLSPEVYLQRPPSEHEMSRLDRLLLKKAKEGVRIYVLLYKEMSLAMDLDSAHSKAVLCQLHENVFVQRHPDHGPDGTFFWAHHEKMLIVDHGIAFMGGLDLAFGRFDTAAHVLKDYHPDDPQNIIWPGQDYNNQRIMDYTNVRSYQTTLIDRSNQPRMPWHDISLKVTGESARDLARHFIQRWNLIRRLKLLWHPETPLLIPQGEYVASRDEKHLVGTCDVQLLRSVATWSSGVLREFSIYNAYVDCITRAKHFIYIENQFFVTTSLDDPHQTVKNKIGQALYERILRAHDERQAFKVIVVMPLVPSFPGDLASPEAATARLVMHWQYASINRGPYALMTRLRQAGIQPDDYISFYSLRSWTRIDTAGKPDPIDSGIASSSSSYGALSEASPSRRNSISSVSAVLGAFYNENAKKEASGPCARYVTEEIYVHTKLMIVDDRTVICGSANLNDRSMLGNRDSEIALVIEDKTQVASVMNGQAYAASQYACSLRCRLFKEHLGLLAEQGYAGSADADALVKDPMQLAYWDQIARQNTTIYRGVFQCVPDDTVRSFADYHAFVPEGHLPGEPILIRTDNASPSCYLIPPEPTRANPWARVRPLDCIQGHLVQFPLAFLERENLTTALSAFLPMELFT